MVSLSSNASINHPPHPALFYQKMTLNMINMRNYCKSGILLWWGPFLYMYRQTCGDIGDYHFLGKGVSKSSRSLGCSTGYVTYASDWVSIAWVPFGTSMSARPRHSSRYMRYYPWLIWQIQNHHIHDFKGISRGPEALQSHMNDFYYKSVLCWQ